MAGSLAVPRDSLAPPLASPNGWGDSPAGVDCRRIGCHWHHTRDSAEGKDPENRPQTAERGQAGGVPCGGAGDADGRGCCADGAGGGNGGSGRINSKQPACPSASLSSLWGSRRCLHMVLEEECGGFHVGGQDGKWFRCLKHKTDVSRVIGCLLPGHWGSVSTFIPLSGGAGSCYPSSF